MYRSTEMAAEAGLLDPQAMLDEIFPAIAYYQDTWEERSTARASRVSVRAKKMFREALTAGIESARGLLADPEPARGLDSPAREICFSRIWMRWLAG